MSAAMPISPFAKLRSAWIANPAVMRLQRLRRTVLQHDQRIRRAYLRDVARPKLQIGGGWHTLDGWLNTDLDLSGPEVMLMDATGRFPFANDVFEYVYSEHMIEHVGLEEGVAVLSECYRVLQPGGVLRVVTPNLDAILSLGSDKLGGLQQRYLSWFYENLLPPDRAHTPAMVINAMFHMWGHRFIYDELTLRDALATAGFHTVVRRRLGESEHSDLRNLENVDRYPDQLLDFESIALEARK